ncbi:MAG: (d)CMP kinase [Candidatus Sumerlaeaceae bacterium]|nr:(d)CMP kinase [Candidatus Sumerlaeaceae bacterium]
MTANAVLIGMMGSGKSTVGRLVAERTGMAFVDLDQMIMDRCGLTITQIFDAGGEAKFREMETEALREILSTNHTVIATGGGVITKAENRRLLRQIGKVFWLDAPAETLIERIGDDESRPMLRGGDALKRLEQLIVERREHYADASDIHLDTMEYSPEEIAIRIEQELGEVIEEFEEDVFGTIIAIDGPVASGKSTVAKAIARRLDYVHVDTGAMYRCVTFEATRRGVRLDDPEGLAAVAHSVDIRFIEPGTGAMPHGDSEHKRVLLNGEDVTEEIRSPEVSRNTSSVADVPAVRGELVRLQREIALKGHSVLEGRDISTVVVPEARWKIFLAASLDERVERRFRQYKAKGQDVDLEQLRHDIIVRDERDRTRPQGGLRLADHAIIFDTTGISLEEVVETVAMMVTSAAGAPSK